MSWTGNSHERDFLTLVPPDTEEGKYDRYWYARSTPLEMQAPDEAGEYELRYLSKDSPYPTLAKVPVTVTPVSATLEVPAQVDAGATITITWTGPDNPRDFITIVETGTPEREYDTYVYTNKGSPAELRAPDEPGSYEIRYLTGQKYYTVASAPIAVGATSATVAVPPTADAGTAITVTWTGPDNQGDWIAISEAGTGPGEYVSWVYTHKGSPVEMRAPDEPGSYEVLYVTGQDDIALARTSMDVTATTATVSAPAEVRGGDSFTVEWTGPDHAGDYIGMTEPGAPQKAHHETWAYTRHGNPATMRAPLEPGQYELRYETGQAGLILARTSIRVTPPETQPGVLRVVAASSAGLAVPSDGAVELILDASGSMLQQQEGRRRIDIARDVLTGLLGDVIPAGTPFALRVFGHREKDSCRTDLEIALRPLDPAAATGTIGGIEAMNLAKTPIAHSLELVADDLATVNGQRVVILVTDGEETCGGDPAAAIEGLKAAGIDVRVDIVGFAIDDEDLKRTFRYWADVGGGSYHDARSADQLSASMSKALSAPFKVVDANGNVVATGVVGDDPLSLPAGTYTVRMSGRGAASEAVVESQKETVVTLAG